MVGARSREVVGWILWSASIQEAWSPPVPTRFDACQAMASMSTPSRGHFHAPDSAVCYSSSTTDHKVTLIIARKGKQLDSRNASGMGAARDPSLTIPAYSCRFLKIPNNLWNFCSQQSILRHLVLGSRDGSATPTKSWPHPTDSLSASSRPLPGKASASLG